MTLHDYDDDDDYNNNDDENDDGTETWPPHEGKKCSTFYFGILFNLSSFSVRFFYQLMTRTVLYGHSLISPGIIIIILIILYICILFLNLNTNIIEPLFIKQDNQIVFLHQNVPFGIHGLHPVWERDILHFLGVVLRVKKVESKY